MTVVAEASPSLALIKYWGKQPGGINLAATSSLAVTLGALHSRTSITETSPGLAAEAADAQKDATARGSKLDDTVAIDGRNQQLVRFVPVIEGVRYHARRPRPVHVESSNDFPTAAGLASSSSGLAALAVGLDAFFETGLSREQLSAVARLGSGSACRAVFGGFTVWPAGAEAARAFLPAEHWEDLRVLIVVLAESKKPVPSREGMERARLSSPYYDSWLQTSKELFAEGCTAVERRDIERLGWAMRQSYLAMFGTMFTSDPPFIYWLPQSLAVIKQCEKLRSGAVPVWETMDAGPQVKLLTLESATAEVIAALRENVPDARIIISGLGGAPTVESSAREKGGPHE